MTSAVLSIEAVLAYLEASIEDVHLSDEERRELVSMLRNSATPDEGLRRVRNRAFDLAQAQIGNTDGLPLLKWLNGVARALDTARAPSVHVFSEAYFSPGTGCLNAIQHRLRSARQHIDICVFTLSDDRITREILDAHRRGVKIRLISDNEKEFDNGSDISELRRAGIAVAVDRTEAHMHHKFALFDGQWLLNGSYNWTRSACEHNEENLVLTNDAAMVSIFSKQFNKLWQALA